MCSLSLRRVMQCLQLRGWDIFLVFLDSLKQSWVYKADDLYLAERMWFSCSNITVLTCDVCLLRPGSRLGWCWGVPPVQSPVWSDDQKGRLHFLETRAAGDFMVSFIHSQQCVCVECMFFTAHVRKLTSIRLLLFFSSTIVEPVARFSVGSVRLSTRPFPSLA